MTQTLEHWQLAMVAAAGVLVLLGLTLGTWKRLTSRRHRHGLIAAARVRAGHLPGNVPTVRGGLDGATAFAALDGDSAFHAPAANEGAYTVDERPSIRIRYVNVMAKKVEAVLHVQHLDTQQRVVTGYFDLPSNVRRIPLRDIVAARSAENGQRFDVDTWVDAVRVARRRRGTAG